MTEFLCNGARRGRPVGGLAFWVVIVAGLLSASCVDPTEEQELSDSSSSTEADVFSGDTITVPPDGSTELPSEDQAPTENTAAEAGNEADMLAVTFQRPNTSEMWLVSSTGERLLGTVVNELGEKVILTDVAVTPNGDIYAIDFLRFYRIDEVDGGSFEAVELARHGLRTPTSLGSTDDGELLVAGVDGLFSLDPTSDTPVLLVSFADPSAGRQVLPSGDLAVDADGRVLVALVEESPEGEYETAPNLLAQLDDVNATVTILFDELPTTLYGLTVVADGLFAFRNDSENTDCPGELFAIDPITGTVELVRCLPFAPGGAAPAPSALGRVG